LPTRPPRWPSRHCTAPGKGLRLSRRPPQRRWRPARAHQNVIVLTANAAPEHREACVLAGMGDFLSKLFQRNELIAVLLRHLRVSVPAALASVGPPA